MRADFEREIDIRNEEKFNSINKTLNDLKNDTKELNDKISNLTSHIQALCMESCYPLLIRSFIVELKIQAINKYLLERLGATYKLNLDDYQNNYAQFNKDFTE